MSDDRPPTMDRCGPEEIEPGRKGGNVASQGRSATKEAAVSDDREAGERAGQTADKGD